MRTSQCVTTQGAVGSRSYNVFKKALSIAYVCHGKLSAPPAFKSAHSRKMMRMIIIIFTIMMQMMKLIVQVPLVAHGTTVRGPEMPLRIPLRAHRGAQEYRSASMKMPLRRTTFKQHVVQGPRERPREYRLGAHF